MHFTQTRIATIDSFPVLFMMVMFLFMARWMQMSFYHQKLWQDACAAGVFRRVHGAGDCQQVDRLLWRGRAGRAVLLRFIALYKQSRYAQRTGTKIRRLRARRTALPKRARRPSRACVVFFVIVPVVIYVLSYIPYLSAYGEVKLNLKTLERIWNAQVTMFEYHKDLVATHYFSSPWYEWPLIIKPMWYYSAAFPATGKASTIMAFGNPAVWWTGSVGILFVLGYSVYRNALPMLRVIPGRDDAYDRALPVIAVGFLSAYLPWVLVSRLTFIYHYFASVPFIILATAQVLRYLERAKPRAQPCAGAPCLCVAAVVAVHRVLSLCVGAGGLRGWLARMNWFKNWMWY